MSTADFWNKLIRFKLDPLTLHGAKSTPDPGLHRSSAVLISHPLGLPGFNQPPWTVQTSMSRWPRPTSSQRCVYLHVCLMAFFCATACSASSPALRTEWVTASGVILNQWSMGLGERHPPGRVPGDICVLLKRAWQNWAPCGPQRILQKAPQYHCFSFLVMFSLPSHFWDHLPSKVSQISSTQILVSGFTLGKKQI